jgi:hypothetical protein
MAQKKPRLGKKGPKRSAGGKSGTNKFASAPKFSSGAKGGTLFGRLTGG